MARSTKELSVKEIIAAKPRDKDYKLTDGRGLYLLVTRAGGKHWKLKYRFDGKEKKISIGRFPEITLAYAREQREKYRSQIAMKIDPSAIKREEKEQEAEVQRVESLTFETVATAYLKKRSELNAAYLVRLERAFKNDVFKYIGKTPISRVTPSDVIELVQRVERRGATESSHRLFTQISRVFKYAVANQLHDRNPCSDIDKNEILKPHTAKHFPTITDPKEIRALLLSIDDYTGDYAVKMALSVAPYVFVRPSNLRFAEWSEINFEAKQWVIAATKMKTKKEHIIPLADTPLSIFKEMYRYSGDAKYIFHSLRSKTAPMSDATLNNALRRLGYSKEEIVVHGFRAMFSTIAHEHSDFDHHIIETQLAHSVGSSVSQAYNRAQHLSKRVELMQWWGNYLDEVKGHA